MKLPTNSGRAKNWSGTDTGEAYDLVVVGGGISGLSAAYFYRQSMGDDARILILDNHDDFGGHAKRNEFEIDGRLMIGFGGSMMLDSPSGYPASARRLIRELGIEPDRFYSAYDRKLYSSLGLKRGVFFDRETFGVDHLAVGDLVNPEVMSRIPLSDRGRADLRRLVEDERHYLDDIPPAKRPDYLAKVTYRSYLSERAGIGDEALKVVEPLPRGVWAVGIDALPAWTAWSSEYPGFGDLDMHVPQYEGYVDEPNIFHFPDGNATVARLLVRAMIPAVAPGDDMEDIVTARFDYARLDREDATVRVRLNSTAVRVEHLAGDPGKSVRVSYVRDGRAQDVTGKQVVLACNHGVIPYLCPELPIAQSDLLSTSLRAPLVYTNVLIRNWHSFVKLGLRRASCPGSYHHSMSLDFPVSLGAYRCPKSPGEPMIVRMSRVPGQPGLSAREQFLAGQRDLLATTFETFEYKIRDQLARILGEGGFDPARDIAGITVNRWPHGYAYGYDVETDRVAFEPSLWPPEKRPWEAASRPFGNIAIAACDAASDSMAEAAIREAHRAVDELSRGG